MQNIEQIRYNEVVKELEQLARLVIEDTVWRILDYFESWKIDRFKELINKSKKYKNGLILKLVWEKLKSLDEEILPEFKKDMISYLKENI